MEVDIIVTTWGSDEWRVRGSATAETNSAQHHHFDQVRSAGAHRNAAVDEVDPHGWIIFLDADDQLGAGYVDAMLKVAGRTNVLHAPALQLGDAPARVLDDRDIIHGSNPCPIGTMIHRIAFEMAGRFWDEPAWEDFAMFQRAVLAGAEITFVSDAVYRAANNPRGRNSTVRNPRWLRRQIQADNQRWLESR